MALLLAMHTARAQPAPVPPSPPAAENPGTESETPTPDQPPPPPLPTPTPEPPAPSWTKQGTALLQVLDKVDGQSSNLIIAVGDKQVFRNVTISVMACFARPPDQAQDAAAYLLVQDNSQTTPNFVGWMLAAEPSSSMMEHPVYDVRVLGCR